MKWMYFKNGIGILYFREYLENIGLVDTGVAELVSLVEDFFDYDGRTAYVFTSDHGMTNWGKMQFYHLQFEKMKHVFLDCTWIFFVQVPMVQAIRLRLWHLYWCGELEFIMHRESLNPKYMTTDTCKVLHLHYSHHCWFKHD